MRRGLQLSIVPFRELRVSNGHIAKQEALEMRELVVGCDLRRRNVRFAKVVPRDS
jgi:hypothetical protein